MNETHPTSNVNREIMKTLAKDHGKIRTFRDLEIVQSKFCRDLGIDLDPTKIFDRLVEEIEELQNAITKNHAKEIKSEIADCVIFLATLSLIYGISLEEGISAKLERNFRKYNPIIKKQLEQQGLDGKSAFNQLRTMWNRTDDKDY